MGQVLVGRQFADEFFLLLFTIPDYLELIVYRELVGHQTVQLELHFIHFLCNGQVSLQDRELRTQFVYILS